MAVLTYQSPTIAGTTLNAVAASVGGDTIVPSASGFLQVKNGGGASITVTIVVPGNTKYGQAQPDVPVTVAAGATALIGILPADLADPSNGRVGISYSSVTSVTVAAVQI